ARGRTMRRGSRRPLERGAAHEGPGGDLRIVESVEVVALGLDVRALGLEELEQRARARAVGHLGRRARVARLAQKRLLEAAHAVAGDPVGIERAPDLLRDREA